MIAYDLNATFRPIDKWPDEETWVSVPGFPNYEASNRGRVRRCTGGKGVRAGRVLRPLPNGTGYWQVNLYRDGVATRCTIHSVVAAAFLGPRPDGHEVNHRDGQKGNNAPSNLEYATPQENKAHAAREGLGYRGARNSQARLTEDGVRRVHQLRASHRTQREIAREVGISQGHVSDILAGRRWPLLFQEAKRVLDIHHGLATNGAGR